MNRARVTMLAVAALAACSKSPPRSTARLVFTNATEAQIDVEAERLRGASLRDAALRDGALEADPAARADLTERLIVTRVRDSRIVEISVASNDAGRALALCKLLVARYARDTTEARLADDVARRPLQPISVSVLDGCSRAAR